MSGLWSQECLPVDDLWGRGRPDDLWGGGWHAPFMPGGCYGGGVATPAPVAGPTELDDPVLQDRALAAKQLESKFSVVEKPDPKIPNQVTQEQYDKICKTYSDIRMGSSHFSFDKKSTADFKNRTMEDFGTIMQTESGRAMIDDLAYSTKKDGSYRTTTLKETNNAHQEMVWVTDPAKRDDIYNGKGASTSIAIAPGTEVDIKGAKDRWLPQRSDVTLYHEMVHAYHMENGTFAEGTVEGGPDAGIDNDEYQAVGLGKYAKNKYTENRYHAERALLAGKPGGLASDEHTGKTRTNYVPTCEHGDVQKTKGGQLVCPK